MVNIYVIIQKYKEKSRHINQQNYQHTKDLLKILSPPPLLPSSDIKNYVKSNTITNRFPIVKNNTIPTHVYSSPESSDIKYYTQVLSEDIKQKHNQYQKYYNNIDNKRIYY